MSTLKLVAGGGVEYRGVRGLLAHYPEVSEPTQEQAERAIAVVVTASKEYVLLSRASLGNNNGHPLQTVMWKQWVAWIHISIAS